MLREEAIEIIQKLIGRFKSDSRTYKALEMAIQALEQEPTEKPMTVDEMEREYEKSKALFHKIVECDDAISRDELLKAIDTWDKFGYTETGCFVREPKGDYVPYIHYDDVIKSIKGMPSVTQKSGKWIEKEGWDGDVYYECSVCGEAFCLIDGTPTDNMYNYCPNCGAKMESEDKE